MRTSEMIAMLEKNPKLKFETLAYGARRTFYNNEGYLRYDVYFPGSNKIMDSDKMGGGFNGNFGINMDWQLVREPVPMWEALQAWAGGKTVKCSLSTTDKETRHNTGIYQGDAPYLQDGNGLGISKDEITTGKWFIEDSPNE